MDERERNYFTTILIETRKLRRFQEALSVVIGRNGELIAVTCTEEYSNTVPEKDSSLKQTSPLYTCLWKFKQLGSPENCSAFFSYFPTPVEVEMLIFAGIHSMYFLGEITNPDTIKYVNRLKDHKISFEVYRINFPHQI